MQHLHFLCLFAAVAVSSGQQFIPSGGPVYVNPNVAAIPSFDAEPSVDRTTQTVYGFLDFTTTIGNTVMVFSPQSAAAAPVPAPKKTVKPAITTAAPITAPASIKPSKPETPKKKSSVHVEVIPALEIDMTDMQAMQQALQPAKPQQPFILSSKVEVKEGTPVKVKKTTKPSSKVSVQSKAPVILSSKVEVVTQKPIISSKVQVMANQKPFSSVVQVLTNEDEEDEVELDANNIDRPEYDFLNRQPAEVVDETYKVVDLKPNSKFHLKPKSQRGNTPKDSRTTGLVSKMGGTIVKDGLTTVHETQVIGTYISGKYAQVLQSTQKVLPKVQKIQPTATARILKTAAPSLPKHKIQLEPTPAGSLHEETALPLEALFHGDKNQNHIRPSRRPGPAVGGPSGKNEVKRFRSRSSKEQDVTQEEEDDYEETSRRKFKPSSPKSSSESTVSPSGRKYQSSNRRSGNAQNNFKGKANHEKEESGGRRGYKSKIQPSALDSSTGSTSLYKFKLQRPSGRWQYKTTPKPRVTIRGRDDQKENEVTSPSPQYVPEGDEEFEGRELPSGEEQQLEPTVTVSTIKVSISTPPDFSDTYYEIATVKSPYIFQAGTVKNTRFITVTTTIEKTLHSIEPTLPVLQPTASEPLTENILASTAPVYDKENNLNQLDSSIATLPAIALGTDVETPPLETLTETFSTTQTLLKTHILPVIRGGTDTTSYTLVQTYHIARLVTATKTLPPMEVYQFVPSKTLKEFNSKLEEAGSELHLELEFGDDGNEEDDESQGVRAFPPDLDLANIGNDFDVSSVDANKLAEALRQAKALRKTTPKPTTEAPTTPLPADQLQQLALLRLLNPNANIPQVVTSSKPVIKLETIFESHVIPIINGASTSFSTLSRALATISKTEYETVTSTVTPALPPVNQLPLNPFLQPQFSVVSTPVVTNTVVTATESKVLKLTFGAKTAYTTLYSTRVVPTILTTYLTTNVPVVPTASPFGGYFPGAFPGFPGFG